MSSFPHEDDRDQHEGYPSKTENCGGYRICWRQRCQKDQGSTRRRNYLFGQLLFQLERADSHERNRTHSQVGNSTPN